MIIYDRNGAARLQIKRRGRLVGFDGRSVGFLKNQHAYDYNGVHRGWFVGGVLRDHLGAVVGFTANATSGTPIRPIRQIAPIPAISEIEPIRPITTIPPIEPIKQLAWSSEDPVGLFRL